MDARGEIAAKNAGSLRFGEQRIWTGVPNTDSENSAATIKQARWTQLSAGGRRMDNA